MSDALSLRKDIKARKPEFKRQGSNKKVRLGSAWRKPRGVHSKRRLCRDGHAKSVAIGWGSPRAVTGLHPNGLIPVRVGALTDLAALDAQKHGAVISSTVGMRKRIALVDELTKKNIKILNINAKSFKESVEKALAKRKERKKGIAKKHDAQPKEEKKKPEKKRLTEEEKREQQRKEAEKVLTQKER